MNENEKLEYTKEDLLNYIKTDEKINKMATKDELEDELLSCVNRALDCSDYIKDLRKLGNKSLKLLNKYAKEYKKEVDMQKYLFEYNTRIEHAKRLKVNSTIDLMNMVEKLLCDNYNIELFRKELPNFEDYYEFNVEDMIFVNTFIKSLEGYKREKINIELIFEELDYSIKEYIDCVNEGYDYKEEFDSDCFVNIVCRDNNEEQEDKDE